jgi:hypothetical protein
MVASLGCFFAHLSYSLRIARLASSFFMLAMQTLPALRRVSQIVPVLINWSMRQRNLAAYRGVRNGSKSGQASVQHEQSQTAAKK